MYPTRERETREESYAIYLLDTMPSEMCHVKELPVNLDHLSDRPNPVFFKFKNKQRKNKKVTAAILAFPLPFGIVGLHRIYLGTAPHVPIIYIGTAGGVFGILPFIDFCVIVLDKDISRYKDNKRVFMWMNEN